MGGPQFKYVYFGGSRPEKVENHWPREGLGGVALPCPGGQREKARACPDEELCQPEDGKDDGGPRHSRGVGAGQGRYFLGGAGAGVEAGAGATSSVLSQFSCARGPGPGVGPGSGSG